MDVTGWAAIGAVGSAIGAFGSAFYTWRTQRTMLVIHSKEEENKKPMIELTKIITYKTPEGNVEPVNTIELYLTNARNEKFKKLKFAVFVLDHSNTVLNQKIDINSGGSTIGKDIKIPIGFDKDKEPKSSIYHIACYFESTDVLGRYSGKQHEYYSINIKTKEIKEEIIPALIISKRETIAIEEKCRGWYKIYKNSVPYNPFDRKISQLLWSLPSLITGFFLLQQHKSGLNILSLPFLLFGFSAICYFIYKEKKVEESR